MKRILFTLSALSLLAVLSPHVHPSIFWPVAFISIAAPLTIPFNLFALLFLLIKKQWKMAILPAFVLLLGLQYLGETYSFSGSKEAPKVEGTQLSVLSFNTSFFRKPTSFSDNYYSVIATTVPKEIQTWIANNDADIKCLQEFYDDANHFTLNNVESLSKSPSGAYYEHYFLAKVRHNNGTRQGLAIFSKYPIVESGEIFMEANNFNGAAFADIAVNKDTIRVINAHLHSTQIKRRKGGGVVSVMQLYKKGVETRISQVELLTAFIRNSPHPIIFCGDINNLPYSYSYQTFGNYLDNTFEEVGEGFGFSLNSKKLFFLRIDNQFHTPSAIVPLSYKTHRRFKLSDHFPVEASYLVKNQK